MSRPTEGSRPALSLLDTTLAALRTAMLVLVRGRVQAQRWVKNRADTYI